MIKEIKKQLAKNAEEEKYNTYLIAFRLRLKKSNRGVKISLGLFEAVFILSFCVAFGPVLGSVFLLEFLPLEADMPLFAKVITVVLPIVFSGLLLRYVYSYVLKPVSIDIDFLKREIFLNNPTTSEYYTGKPWSKSIRVDDIEHFTIREDRDSDNTIFYQLQLCLNGIKRLDLLILRSKKDAEYMSDVFSHNLQVKEYKEEA